MIKLRGYILSSTRREGRRCLAERLAVGCGGRTSAFSAVLLSSCFFACIKIKHTNAMQT